MSELRGLDRWLDRHHEIQDVDPDPVHPDEQSLLESVDAEIERELDTAEATRVFEALFQRIREREDERMGAYLEARTQGRGR